MILLNGILYERTPMTLVLKKKLAEGMTTSRLIPYLISEINLNFKTK